MMGPYSKKATFYVYSIIQEDLQKILNKKKCN